MNNSDAHHEWITGKGALTIAGTKVELEITVPAKPVRATRMLPVFQQLTNAVVKVGVSNAEATGAQISCTKGCGACCRQLVPIAESEAYLLRELVEAMPEPRRSMIRNRFAAAKEKLQSSGLWQQLLSPGELSTEARRQLGLTYFQEGIACPFLEEESCGVHPDRPLACREYLVTSPAENCAAPSAETVQCVVLPGSVSRIVQTLTATRGVNWLPLVLALDWAAAHPDQSPARSGPEWLQIVFQQLTKQ
ncbi:MAG: YkgJ family cysteine cluster protein [Blastocatellia bacterium]|nr:YkgJ family cysteine cluster protein [Blastocatellia bacterium]